MDKPTWASLEVCGQYYQEFVDDYKSVLSQHCMATVTTYGVRKSRTCASPQTDPEKRMYQRQKPLYKHQRYIIRNVGMHACTQIILTPEIIKV